MSQSLTRIALLTMDLSPDEFQSIAFPNRTMTLDAANEQAGILWPVGAKVLSTTLDGEQQYWIVYIGYFLADGDGWFMNRDVRSKLFEIPLIWELLENE